MKDVLIIFQALLFAVWIAGVLLRKRQLVRNKMTEKLWTFNVLYQTGLLFRAICAHELDGIYKRELKLKDVT